MDFGNKAATIVPNSLFEINASTDQWLVRATYTGVTSPSTVVVTVYADGGESTQKGDSLNGFTYYEPPIATAMSPAVGTDGGGTSITIYGSNLIGDFLGVDPAIGIPVTFDGVPAESYHYNFAPGPLTAAPFAAGSITAVSPPGMGNVPVFVETPGGLRALNRATSLTSRPPR